MSSLPDVSVITVSHNHRLYLDRCLTALANQGGSLSLEIFVVDNASQDGTADFVREHFPQVRLLAERVRRGFSANNNLAIRRSQGRYILLLNPDTEAAPTALEQLVHFMDTHPEVGVCGPQLRFPDGSVQPSCRAFPTWRSVLVRRTPLRCFLKNSAFNRQHLMLDLDHTLTQEVDWMLGACLMIRRETLDEIGLLDERYFLYIEDIDFCLRAHRRGWKVYYRPEAVVIHHHLAVSDRKLFSKYSYYHFMSMFYYFLKYQLPGGGSILRPVGERLVDWLTPRRHPDTHG